MREYLVRARDGRPLAVLVAESQSHAWLYALREVRGYSHLEVLKPIEEVVAEAAVAWERLGLSPKQAAIAAEGMRELRPHVRRIEVPHQEAILLAGKPIRKPAAVGLYEVTPQGRGLQHNVEPKEADARKALEESWRRLHPEFTEAQIQIAATGR